MESNLGWEVSWTLNLGYYQRISEANSWVFSYLKNGLAYTIVSHEIYEKIICVLEEFSEPSSVKNVSVDFGFFWSSGNPNENLLTLYEVSFVSCN